MDDTRLLQAAINAGTDIPAGRYTVSDTLRVREDFSGMNCAGRGQTVFIFNPPYPGAACIEVSSIGNGSGQDITYNRLSGFSITSPDTTTPKVGVRLVGASQPIIRDATVSGWTGSGSIGLQVRGHNAGTVENCTIEADAPISIESNPNSPYQHGGTVRDDLDHFVFRDLYALARGSFPIIQIASGLAVQNLIIEGRQAWVGGRAGLEWIDTACPQIGYTVVLQNVRWEQSLDPQGWLVNIQHNHGLQGLALENCRNEKGNGVYLRKCNYSTIRNYVYGATGTALDVDACDTVALEGSNYFQTGGKVNIGKGAKRQRGRYTQGSNEVVIG